MIINHLYRFAAWASIGGSILAAACSGDRFTPPPCLPENTWQGVLEIPRIELTRVLHITRDAAGNYSAKLDSPGEDDFNRAVNSISLEDSILRLEVQSLAGYYKGIIEGENRISGHWIRGRILRPLTFERTAQKNPRGISGSWQGSLIFPSKRVGVLLKCIRRWYGAFKVTVDIPGLAVENVPATRFRPTDSGLEFQVPALKAAFSGSLKRDSLMIKGTWHWRGGLASSPLLLRPLTREYYGYRIPEELHDGWETASLTSQGLDSSGIAHLIAGISEGQYKNIHSILIVRNGKLIYEQYFAGYTRDTKHDTRSITKSVTALLTGIALEKGYIPDLHASLYSFFPEYAPFRNWIARKNDLTLRHVLTMTSGLACNDWSRTSIGYEENLYRGQDWVKSVLDLPMPYPPGKHWAYCSGGVIVLGAAIAKASGLSFPEFAGNYLFTPLGIRDYQWQYSPEGQANAGNGLHARPRDLAKIGYLILNGGRWQGNQIVSERWIREMLDSQVIVDNEQAMSDRHGYLWWRKTFRVKNRSIPSFYAAGNGGQFIIVIPELQLVMVFSGGNYDSRLTSQPLDILKKYILPYAQGNSSAKFDTDTKSW